MAEEKEEVKEMNTDDYAMQFDGIRLDSGLHADEIIPLTSLIPLVKQYTGKKLAHEFSKILKGHN